MGKGGAGLNQQEGSPLPSKGSRAESAGAIIYKPVRLSLAAHKKLLKIEAYFESAHHRAFTHSEVIEEVLNHWDYCKE